MNFSSGQAKAKLEEIIHDRQEKSAAAIERVNREVPEDAVVRTTACKFSVRDGGVIDLHPGADGVYSLHENAVEQVAGVGGIPAKYLRELASGEDWQHDVAEVILNQSFSHAPKGQRQLVRRVGTQVRGFLSDRYRRLDSRPILDAFLKAATGAGAVPYAAIASDLTISVRCLLPGVYEPVRGDWVGYGLHWSNSDFGEGKHKLALFILRLICINGATLEDAIKQIHLGSRLDDTIEFSKRTYELDTKTTVSAITDATKALLGGNVVEKLNARVERAADEPITTKALQERLKKVLTKAELKAITDAFEGQDVVNLPPGQNTWRASNALSYFAHTVKDEDRSLELEKLAGNLLKEAA